MTKRVRYDGPHEEVAVFDSEADVYAPPVDVVKRGGLLSVEAPARVRDDLIKNNPDWSEVNQAEQKTTSDKDGEK